MCMKQKDKVCTQPITVFNLLVISIKICNNINFNSTEFSFDFHMNEVKKFILFFDCMSK